MKKAKEAFSKTARKQKDPLNVIMQKYKEVPDLFYMMFLGSFLVVQVLSGVFTHFSLSVVASVSGVLLGCIFVVPISIVAAVSGTVVGLNVISEFVAGLSMPGDIVGVMCFKALSYNIVIQAINLSSDQKMGHYLHVPPRHMFIAQILGTVYQSFISNYIGLWAETGLDEQFKNQPNAWSIRNMKVFLNAGGIWGAIGPARFFFESNLRPLLWGFLIGFVLPVLPWLGNKVYKHSFWRLINIPVMTALNFTGTFLSAPLTALIVNFIFNKIIYTYKKEWWKKYNFSTTH